MFVLMTKLSQTVRDRVIENIYLDHMSFENVM